MKDGQTQFTSTLPTDFHRLVKTSAAAAGTSIQETMMSMALYFWGFTDSEIRARQEAAATTIKALTKGKRPFEQAEGMRN